MITQSSIEEIMNRTDIIDVVGEFVKLKKRGANYLGLCPFHGEKTPSFTVSPTKEIYKCFGCGKSGNAVTFLMEHEKYSYVEALRWLAQRYNIAIEETEVSDDVKQQLQVADSLYIINSFAEKYFSEQLWQTEEGNNIALTYLIERGFNKTTLKKFQVGYSPNVYDAFTQRALKAQYNPDLLIKAGLVAKNQHNDQLRDNYKGRIIFPVHNLTGKVIGFGARIIGKAENTPKYINTPENEIYVKSKILYGSYFARQAINKENECLLVEGYTDVISLAQAGVDNVVASGGTSLTIEQLRLIKKYTNNLTIIYDGDSAGIKAAMRGLDMALEEALNVKLVLIPDGEDPDSYVKKVGEKKFKDFIQENKKDFIFFQLEVFLKEAGNDINKKNDAVNKIAETISKINKAEDFTKQQEYVRQCASLMNIDEGGLTNLVNKYTRNQISKIEKNFAFEQQKKEQESKEILSSDYFQVDDLIQEKNLLRVLLEYGLNETTSGNTVADLIFSVLEIFPLHHKDYIRLFELYKKQYEQGMLPTTKTIMYAQDADLSRLVADVTIFPYELSDNWEKKSNEHIFTNPELLQRKKQEKEEQQKKLEISDVELSIIYYKLRKIKRMIDENQNELEKAREEKEINQKLFIHQQLKQFEKEITDKIGAVIVK